MHYKLQQAVQRSVTAALFVLMLVPRVAGAASAELETGYRHMYNLDFQAAHQAFEDWKSAHPEDPLGPVSNAAAYLFAEFDRLGILEIELFTDNQRFESLGKPSPDPDSRIAFEKELARTDALVEHILEHSPRDSNAMFAGILANGLRGDYVALIEKKNFEALKYMKKSRATAEKLLAQSPDYYDAYLAIGVENYLLSLKPAPVRWFLRIGGAQTDREEGISRLRLTAEKGNYLQPYARLLLAVAALRDDDRSTAKELLAGLSGEFPQNRLYKHELDRIK